MNVLLLISLVVLIGGGLWFALYGLDVLLAWLDNE